MVVFFRAGRAGFVITGGEGDGGDGEKCLFDYAYAERQL